MIPSVKTLALAMTLICCAEAANAGRVEGVSLQPAERDRLRKDVRGKLIAIQPSVDPSAIRLRFHTVFDGETVMDNLVSSSFRFRQRVPRGFIGRGATRRSCV